MSQNKTSRRGKHPMPGDRRRILITVVLVLGLLGTGGVFARWAGVASPGQDQSKNIAPAGFTPGSPSKEYIYAGGRLIATEEPVGGACSYVIAPTSQNFSASGGPGTNISVTAPGGCAWTATSNAAWITITSGTPGSGNGSVGYTVAANSGVARNSTMTIAGQTFTVTQDAGGSCSYLITPTSANFQSGGGSSSVTVTAGTGCAWTATSNAAWITITSGTPGSGNGSVGYSVGANVGSARNGTMTIAGQTFSVSQDAAGGGGAPSLSNMSPATGIQGASFPLTINGSNLTGTTSINLTPPDNVTFTNINSTAGQVTCTMSIGAGAAVGGRLLTVTTGGGTSNALVFTINSSSPAPTIGSISPTKKARGDTFTLTVNGTNLSQTSAVNFSPSTGITVSNIVNVSSTQVTATVSISAGAATGVRQVSVTTPNGTSNTKSFTVN